MKEEPSLWLKVSGKELDMRSIPIYELGDTLVALLKYIGQVLHEKISKNDLASNTDTRRIGDRRTVIQSRDGLS